MGGRTRATRAPIRVLVVDDHRLVAGAIERLVGQEDDMVVVGTAGAVSGNYSTDGQLFGSGAGRSAVTSRHWLPSRSSPTS